MTPPDPMALPAPPELLLFLFGLTFVLHLAFLGLLVAGLWARAGAEWGERGAYEIEPLHRAGVLGFSTTITAGVAPLLFVQVLYGKYFYSSSISIGYPWLSVIGYLLVGFYALYIWRWRWDKAVGPSIWGKFFVVLSMAAVAAIAFTYSWNHLVSLSPRPWAHPISHLEVMRRLIGYGGAVAAASGAWALWAGHSWRPDRTPPRGGALALLLGAVLLGTWGTTSNFAAGQWGLSSWSMILFGAFLALLAGVVALWRRFTPARWAALLAAALGLVGLTLQRESYRLMILTGDYNAADQLIRTQWGPFAMFAVTFLLGIATLLWLFVQVRRAQRAT